MDDGGQRMLGCSRVEQGPQLLTISDVAGRHLYLAAVASELGRELRRTWCGDAATARQKQAADAPGSCEVTPHQRADAPSATGDQDGSTLAERLIREIARLNRGLSQPRHMQCSGTQRQLRLVLGNRQRAWQHAPGPFGVIDVDERE